MTKLHFISLGCPKNLVDSEVMLGHLIGAGFVLTNDPADAETIVVNTCAFVEDAKKEAVDTILEMGRHKKSGHCRLLIVAGCLPQRYKKDVSDLFPEVDIFIGAGEFPKIAELISAWERGRGVFVSKPSYLYDHLVPRFHISPRHVAYIKIAEGCFHPCSFCVIPKIRGAYRSRMIDSIVKEAREQIENGARELNLIAQDTTAFGRDTGESLAVLLERLSLLKGPKWVRIMYAYPQEFPPGVIDMMREFSDICRYIDVPIQHISDRILKSMKRRGGSREIRMFLEKIRRDLPGISLRTSLIVGYPGETDADFDELLDFVCEARFENLGVFVYSPEEGTTAFRLKKGVPRDVAEARRDEIMGVQRELSLGNNQRFLNRMLKVLVEGSSSESNMLLQGRHEGQAPEIDGVVLIKEGLAASGDFVNVRILEAREYDLVGKLT